MGVAARRLQGKIRELQRPVRVPAEQIPRQLGDDAAAAVPALSGTQKKFHDGRSHPFVERTRHCVETDEEGATTDVVNSRSSNNNNNNNGIGTNRRRGIVVLVE